MAIRGWNWGTVGVLLAGVVILITIYQVVESSEGELRAEMQRLDAERKADMQRMEAELKAEMRRLDAERKSDMQRIEAARQADNSERKAEMQRIEAARQTDKSELRAEIAALSAKLDRFIERVDSRLDEVELEQARLSAVNDMLAQQSQR